MKIMRFPTAIAVILLLIATSPPLGAQDNVLTLEAAVKRALEQNEQSLAADQSYAAAGARVTRARAYFLPQITGTGVYTRRPFQVVRDFQGTQIAIQRYNALSGVLALNLTLFDPLQHPQLSKRPLRPGRPDVRIGRGTNGSWLSRWVTPTWPRWASTRSWSLRSIATSTPGSRSTPPGPATRPASSGSTTSPGPSSSSPPPRWASPRSRARCKRPISSWDISSMTRILCGESSRCPDFLLKAAEEVTLAIGQSIIRGPKPAA